MHKHLLAGVVGPAVIFIIALLSIPIVRADDALPWISSALSTQKQGDIASIPASMGGNGNIDCAMEDSVNCSVSTTYGVGTQNGTVRLGSSNSFLPVITNVDNRQHFLPVPNSGSAISYFSGPPYGLDLAFNYRFSSSVTKVGSAFQINQAPDGKLADRAKHLLAADTASMSFSENGQWMVVSDPNVAMLRINLQSFEVVPFAAGLNYTIGLDPAVRMAITNDGRYALVASKTFNTFKIYDLSTCGAAPDTINGPIACQSRDLGSFMQQAALGYSFVVSARFANDNIITFYAVYKSGSVNKTARFVISTSSIVNQIDYLALGDSYISGEGAFDYQGGTDTNTNRCHLSLISYPYLTGHELNYNSYHSVACSGATTNDITNTAPDYIGQADYAQKVTRAVNDKTNKSQYYLDSFSPGYIDQLDFVSNYQPKAITVSVFGNDLGMISKFKNCTKPDTCFSTYEERLEFVREINNKFSTLVSTYNQIKKSGAPDMRVYAIGYPQIAKPNGDCALNVHLNNDEVIFTVQAISYLDTVIKRAAAKAGVYYVDTQDAFNGHRLCEAGPGSVAMNGVTAGNDLPAKLGGPIGSESYHPNDFGHQLLENEILTATHNLTDSMPVSDLTVAPPAESGLEILNAPHGGQTVNAAEYDPGMAGDFTYRQVPIDINVNGSAHAFAPGTDLQAQLHSDPVALGTYTTNTNGDLTAQVTIPATVPAGYHSLHFYGTDISGQQIDIYKIIYVAGTADDIDGDGITDSTQKCVGIPSSGQDFDQDKIDDACDGFIGTAPPAPAATPLPQVLAEVTPPTKIPADIVVTPASNDDKISAQTAETATDQSLQNAGIITVASSSNERPATQQQSVLDTSTYIQSTKPSPSPSKKITSPRNYLVAGLGIFSITSLTYTAKRWLRF